MPVEPLSNSNQSGSNDGLVSPSPPIDFSKPIQRSDVRGRNILVTGGANGIGAGFVTALAEAGAHVTIADVKEEDGEQHANELNSKGLKVQFIPTDVASFESQAKTFASAIDFHPSKSLDIVIAVAGVRGHSILDWLNKTPIGDPSALKPPPTSSVDINLTGVYFTTHLAMHYFRKPAESGFAAASSRQLIFISSLAGYLNLPFTSDYAGAKYGVRGIWRSIRSNPRVLGQSVPPFRTNLLAPTFIQTGMIKGQETTLDKMGAKYGVVDDVVLAMMRLVCDESIYGRAIAVCQDNGSFDICDDENGLDGGPELNKSLSPGGILYGLSHLAKVAAAASVDDDWFTNSYGKLS